MNPSIVHIMAVTVPLEIFISLSRCYIWVFPIFLSSVPVYHLRYTLWSGCCQLSNVCHIYGVGSTLAAWQRTMFLLLCRKCCEMNVLLNRIHWRISFHENSLHNCSNKLIYIEIWSNFSFLHKICVEKTTNFMTHDVFKFKIPFLSKKCS